MSESGSIQLSDPGIDQALKLLRSGHYREGFALYEKRNNLARIPLKRLGWPEWRGEPLDGKTIVVWGEQGLGDEIQMARFVRNLKERNASVWIACNPVLRRLFETLPADGVTSRIGSVVLPNPVDYWIPAMSLPLALEIAVEDIDGRAYLSQPSRARHRSVGLCWRGNPENPRDAQRSLPTPALLIEAFPNGLLLEASGDMSESAAQVADLAALVTVDTAWAHLAGAMGIPTFLLLDTEPDWRWGDIGQRSAWYDSVRIYRQRTPGDWRPVIAEAAADIFHHLSSTSQAASGPELTVQTTVEPEG